jgi:hypothetical protein
MNIYENKLKDLEKRSEPMKQLIKAELKNFVEGIEIYYDSTFKYNRMWIHHGSEEGKYIIHLGQELGKKVRTVEFVSVAYPLKFPINLAIPSSKRKEDRKTNVYYKCWNIPELQEALLDILDKGLFEDLIKLVLQEWGNN